MKSNQIIKERAFEIYESGITRPTDITRRLADEGYIDVESVRSIRRTVSNWVKSKNVSDTNPGLALECDTVGIPLDSVKHGWYKGKHWSIAFKADQEEGPSFEDMLKLCYCFTYFFPFRFFIVAFNDIFITIYTSPHWNFHTSNVFVNLSAGY